MADRNDEMTAKEQIQAIMDELGLDWEAAALLYTIESGNAFVDDIVFEWTTAPEAADPTERRDVDEHYLVADAPGRAEHGAAKAGVASRQAVGRPRSAKRVSSAA